MVTPPTKLKFPFNFIYRINKVNTDKVSNFLRHRNSLPKEVDIDENTISGNLNKKLSGEKIIEWLYSILSILDSKASALMRLNGIILAATFFLINKNNLVNNYYLILPVFGSLLTLLSIFYCLFIVGIAWPFLSFAHKKDMTNNPANKKSEEMVDYTIEFKYLQEFSELRQRHYIKAWYLSFIAFILLFIFLSILLYHILFI